jgi:hypothetical protein
MLGELWPQGDSQQLADRQGWEIAWWREKSRN